MPAEGTTRIPEFISTKIKQLAYDFERVYNKRPTWQEVQNMLEAWMKRTPASYGSQKTLWTLYKDNIPKRAAILARMGQARAMRSVDDPIEDAPWNLSMSAKYGFPDDATGELYELWKYSITFLDMLPFTVRVARWANRLRFIKDAGGTREGLVDNPDVLIEFAFAYAAREKAALMVAERRGQVVTPVDSLDADLMYREQPALWKLSTELGAFQGIGPESWITELNTENPVIGNELEETLDFINDRITEKNKRLVFKKEMAERIGKHPDDDLVVRVEQMTYLGMQKLKRALESRGKAVSGLKDGNTYEIIFQAIMRDVIEMMERGENATDNWEPPIDNLIWAYYDRRTAYGDERPNT